MAKPRTPEGRCRRTNEELKSTFPEAECELDFENPFQLLVATILSAQATDKSVNKSTPKLFEVFGTPEKLAVAEIVEIEKVIKTIGLFRSKAKNLQGMAQRLLMEYGGEVPSGMDDLVTLPGVGRKTANVVRSVSLGLPGLPVDTHVSRIVQRLGITQETNPVKIEKSVGSMLPDDEHGEFSLRVILHGRQVCFARKPNCAECVLNYFCPVAFKV